MKLSYCSTLLILFLSVSCKNNDKPKVNCSLWHIGQFEIVDDKRNIHIERTESMQLETDRNSGLFTKFAINWVDNCTYQLKFLEGEEGVYSVWQNNYLQVTITAPTESGYRYSAKFSTSSVIEEGEITFVK